MEPYDVLCLGTGNSARSIMGEALPSLGQGPLPRVQAGGQPKGQVHPRPWRRSGVRTCPWMVRAAREE